MEKKIIENKLYRIARARYNGVWIEGCLIPEDKYSAIQEEKKSKKRKKTPRKSLENELDNLWSEAIKIKWRFKCAYCGGEKSLNSHHIFSRGNKNTRWDTNNGICLCACHHTLCDFSAHKSPHDFMKWLEGLIEPSLIENLSMRSKISKSHSVQELELMKWNLENYIKNHG